MDISKYELIFMQHALKRADERNINIYLITKALHNGLIERFGKHGVKFILRGKKRTIICVGHIIGIEIKIFTVEEK